MCKVIVPGEIPGMIDVVSLKRGAKYVATMTQIQTALNKYFAPEVPGTGSAVFFQLSPTCRITEFITFVFYPVFMGVLGNAIGVWAMGINAIIGGGLAWFAIYMRRGGEHGAYAAYKKFENRFADNAIKGRELTNPHPSLLHAVTALMLVGEVMILCITIPVILLYAYFHDIYSLRALFNALQPYIGDFFSFYSGFDHEIKALVFSPYSGRVIILKLAVFFTFIACTYACVIMSIRMMYGWRKYWGFLNLIRDIISIKHESIVLFSLIISVPFIALCINSLFYQNSEFFLIMGKVPDEDWYVINSLALFSMYAFLFVIFLFAIISIFIPYLVIVYFYCINSIFNHRFD